MSILSNKKDSSKQVPLTVSSLPEALRHLLQHLAEVLPLVAGGEFHHEADVQRAILGAPEAPTPTDWHLSVGRAAGRGIWRRYLVFTLVFAGTTTCGRERFMRRCFSLF